MSKKKEAKAKEVIKEVKEEAKAEVKAQSDKPVKKLVSVDELRKIQSEGKLIGCGTIIDGKVEALFKE